MLQLTRLDNFPWLGFNEKLPAVEVSQGKLEATECFTKRQGMFNKQIITLPLKLGVLLLLQDKHYVPGNCVRLQYSKLSSKHCQLNSKETTKFRS